METEPDLTATAQRMIIPIGRAEKTTSHRRIGHARQMAHNNVQRQYSVVRDLPGSTFQRFFEIEQRHLGHPFDRYTEHTVLALARQNDFQLEAIVSDRQWIPRVQIVAPIENGFEYAEYFAVCMDHGLDDLAINLICR